VLTVPDHEPPGEEPFQVVTRWSFAGPHHPGESLARPQDCTCGNAHCLTFEPNEFTPYGDVVDWHADWCGFWGHRIPREHIDDIV
jgi:hypothetical protein